MHFEKILIACCLGYSTFVFAQATPDIQCQKAILEAEKQRTPQIYHQCGFDDAGRAFIHWKDWADRNNAYQAMYELCVRYPEAPESISLCQKAALGGNGPALIHLADRLYEQKKYAEAFLPRTALPAFEEDVGMDAQVDAEGEVQLLAAFLCGTAS